MNEKFEDKLIRLAFEETSPKETSALELQALADPEAARTLESYRKVRIGLNLLTEVPPDQLSKERLRNAILGQGLKPLPPQPSRWGWAWMPATACALVFGWLGVRHLNTPEPKIVGPGLGSVAMRTATPVLHVETKRQERTTSNTVVASLKNTQTPKAHKSLEPRPIDPPAANVLVSSQTKPAKPPIALAIEKKTASSSVVARTEDNPGKLTSINSPMVVINPENDNNSGAQKATEVDGASNVVVGG
jgi:hypothetical protein